MRFDRVQDAELVAEPSGDVARLLEAAFGFLVWAGHLVVIYVANAVTCALGLTSGNPRAESRLVMALAAITIVAAAVVGVHGVKRYRGGPMRVHSFLHSVAVGSDAIATLAILWQLIPIFITPVCR